MLIVATFAFIAGVLTILAPCTLPLVPLVLGASATGGGRRIPGLFVGFGGAFVVTTVLLAAVLANAGLSTDGLRTASAIILGAVGITLAVDRIGTWVGGRLDPIAEFGTRLVRRRVSVGFAGDLLLGACIGLVWAPCVGPIMAAVIAEAATRGPSVEALAIAAAYVAGAAVPLSLIALWGRRASSAMSLPARGPGVRRGFGGLMVASGLLIASGPDITIVSGLPDVLPPGWSGPLVAVAERPPIQREIDMPGSKAPAPPDVDVTGSPRDPETLVALPAPIASALPVEVSLADLGPTPELIGIDTWINTEPLSIAALRGKVVLIEFWTFGCINCQHVQPYVIAWSDRYAASGLVVIGVHTPELSFERDIANVREAVATAGIRFPVAVDPSFATWNAYHNAYWPAFYFVDRAGRIRHVHFGEGDYDGSEQVIRELLAGS